MPNELRNAMSKIRKGVLIFFLSVSIDSLILWLTFNAIINKKIIFPNVNLQTELLIIVFIIPIIVSSSYFVHGFDTLYSQGFSIWSGHRAGIYLLRSAILFFIGSIIWMGLFLEGEGFLSNISPYVLSIEIIGLILLFLAILFEFFAILFLGSAFHQMGDFFDEALTKVGGDLLEIAMILSIFIFGISIALYYPSSPTSLYYLVSIPIIILVSLAIIYIGLGKLKNIKINQLQISQVGDGILTTEGIAYFIIRSNLNGKIVGASIEGLNAKPVGANTTDIVAGENKIGIQFDNIGQLTLGKTYKLILMVASSSTQQSTVEISLVCTEINR